VPLSEGAGGFAALGAALYEQAAGFYADDARRVLQAHAERKQPPSEANARTAFKVCNEELPPGFKARIPFEVDHDC
jgi:hypothetical protein